MSTDTVAIGYCYNLDVAHAWHVSYKQLLFHDMAHDGHVMRGGELMMRCGTGGLIDARNKVAQQVVDSDVDWLLWLDTDGGFAPDTLDRLLDAADPVERPIMGALCFGLKEEAADGMGGWQTRKFPTIYLWGQRQDGQEGTYVRGDYPDNTVVPCMGTGCHCVLIHRTVFEKVHAEYGTWYDRVRIGDMLYGEDISFCLRANSVQMPTHVHTGVKTTHQKTVWVSDTPWT